MKKLLVIFVAAGVFVLPPAAEAKSKTFTVGESVVKWTSPEKYDRDEAVTVRFTYRGRNLDGAMIRRDCVTEYAGYGIVARVWACDNGSKPSPLRVRIASARDDTVKVKMTYWR